MLFKLLGSVCALTPFSLTDPQNYLIYWFFHLPTNIGGATCKYAIHAAPLELFITPVLSFGYEYAAPKGLGYTVIYKFVFIQKIEDESIASDEDES